MSVPAVAAGAGPTDRDLIDELKAPQDPTILKRRIWLDTEWNSFKDSSDNLDFTLGGLWAWPISANQDWAVRLNVPVSFHRAGNAPGDANEQGLGDLKLATGTAVRFSDSRRAAIGVEMRFPTAHDKLGDNAWRAQLFGTAAWDVTRSITLSPSAEYNKSIAEKTGTAPQHFLELFLPAVFILSRYWSVTPRYELKVDFADNDRITHSAKLSVAKQLEQVPLGFSLSLKKPLDGGDKKFQVNFVTTYYFQ